MTPMNRLDFKLCQTLISTPCGIWISSPDLRRLFSLCLLLTAASLFWCHFCSGTVHPCCQSTVSPQLFKVTLSHVPQLSSCVNNVHKAHTNNAALDPPKQKQNKTQKHLWKSTISLLEILALALFECNLLNWRSFRVSWGDKNDMSQKEVWCHVWWSNSIQYYFSRFLNLRPNIRSWILNYWQCLIWSHSFLPHFRFAWTFWQGCNGAIKN